MGIKLRRPRATVEHQLGTTAETLSAAWRRLVSEFAGCAFGLHPTLRVESNTRGPCASIRSTGESVRGNHESAAETLWTRGSPRAHSNQPINDELRGQAESAKACRPPRVRFGGVAQQAITSPYGMSLGMRRQQLSILSLIRVIG